MHSAIHAQSTKVSHAEGEAGNEVDLLEKMVRILVQHLFLLLGISLAGAAVTTAVYYYRSQPQYISSAYFSISKAEYFRFQAILQSPAVLDAAAATAGLDLSSMDVARGLMRDRLTFEPASGDDRANASIYTLQVRDSEAPRARAIAQKVIDKWFEVFMPKVDHREEMEQQLAREQTKLADLNKVLGSFRSEITSYVAPATNSGELATPLVGLLTERTRLEGSIDTLQRNLRGLSKDIILVAPTLPDTPKRPVSIGMVFLAGFAAVFALVFAVLIWRDAAAAYGRR